eukprot:scaffold266_cov391-Prasinococcus_capsulatus_cf.AAC.46
MSDRPSTSKPKSTSTRKRASISSSPSPSSLSPSSRRMYRGCCCSTSLSTSRKPKWIAKCMALSPLSGSMTFGSAPRCSSTRITSACPLQAAKCSGVARRAAQPPPRCRAALPRAGRLRQRRHSCGCERWRYFRRRHRGADAGATPEWASCVLPCGRRGDRSAPAPRREQSVQPRAALWGHGRRGLRAFGGDWRRIAPGAGVTAWLRRADIGGLSDPRSTAHPSIHPPGLRGHPSSRPARSRAAQRPAGGRAGGCGETARATSGDGQAWVGLGAVGRPSHRGRQSQPSNHMCDVVLRVPG